VRRNPLSSLQVGEDGEHPAVIGVRRLQAELAEDVADVLFDGALGDDEAVGDGAVGAACDGVDELADVGDPVLEQVAEKTRMPTRG